MKAGEADDSAGKRPGRVDAVDCARGLALIGMAAYHLSWDLADFRLAPPMLPFAPPMRLLSHVVASASDAPTRARNALATTCESSRIGGANGSMGGASRKSARSQLRW